MELKPKDNCPLNNFEPCKQLDCAWFVQMRGTNPNSGKEVDEFACAVAWLPMLLVENAAQTRQSGAAIESFRNEMVKGQEAAVKTLKVASMFHNREAKQVLNLTD